VTAPALPTEVSTAKMPAQLRRVILPSMPQRVRPKRFGGLLGLTALLVIGIPSLIAAAYYGFWASNQYVTSFVFAVRGPTQSVARPAVGSALVGTSATSPDAFVVTDYINSPQAVSDVAHALNLSAIFSKPTIDFWSRLAPEVTPEELDAYWAKMVSAHFDLVSGNVSVSVRTFTPEDSLNLARALIAASNEMFRRLNAEAQHDFVRLADENLSRAQQQLSAARQALLAFRDSSGLIDPALSAQAGSAMFDDLRKQLSALQVQYAAIRASSPSSPTLAVLRSQIGALEAQLKGQDQRSPSPVKAVSPEVFGQYQSLDLDRQFAEKQYTESLDLRNQAYLMAQNQQSYLALFVQPTLPHTSLYPDRTRAIATVVLAAAAAWFIGMLITYAVRDHLM
jgi:capsular polysaccharide transport system permease protein